MLSPRSEIHQGIKSPHFHRMVRKTFGKRINFMHRQVVSSKLRSLLSDPPCEGLRPIGRYLISLKTLDGASRFSLLLESIFSQIHRKG